MIAEIIYHKARKADFLEKTRTQIKTLFGKYHVQRSDFRDLQIPEALKGYDLYKRPNQIRTSKQK
jgi:hypothetical protein